MAIHFMDIAGKRELLIPGMAGYVHFSDIIWPGTRTERVNLTSVTLHVTSNYYSYWK
jgi:hypothetical protein